MNLVDYFFENTKDCRGLFIAGSKETITFAELYRLVISRADYLFRKYGSNKEIMLISDNSLFFVLNYLAIIKSNNTVILVETNISQDQLDKIILKCSLSAIIIQNKYRHLVDTDVDIYDESNIEDPELNFKNRELITTENIIAVVIFTSGSTGEKKGVMLSHENIISNTNSIIEYLELKSTDRIEVVLPFYYCFGTSLLHTHLRVGGSMVINRSIFLGSVLKEMNDFKCTGFAGVPATYQILINKTEFLKYNFTHVRYFAQAGGKLPDHFITQITNNFPSINFYVMYGATEATARLSYLPPTLVNEKLGSIGRGIPGVKLEVVNSLGELIKPNEVGEITAMGNNIMKGYYKDLESTIEVLKNGRYFTGDLATVDLDGYIYILGRKKNIIKSAGFRISPYEIESLIVSIEKITDCVVIGLVDEIVGEEIIAIVETIIPSEKLKLEILNICNKKLDSYKVPQKIIFLEKFPLNSSKKIDRVKVKELALDKLNQNKEF